MMGGFGYFHLVRDKFLITHSIGLIRIVCPVKLSISTNKFHSKAIEDIFYQNGIFCFVDCDRDLYMYDISRKSKIYIRNLSSLVQKYGVITGIVPFYEDIIIGFRANGLIRLRTSKKV